MARLAVPALAAVVVAVLLLHGSLAAGAVAEHSSRRGLLVRADPSNPNPSSVPFDKQALQLKSPDLDMTDPRLSKQGAPCAPEQTRITYWTTRSVLVSWSTCEARVGANVTAKRPTAGVEAWVDYGPDPGMLTNRAAGTTTAFLYDYNRSGSDSSSGGQPSSYASPYIHHVLLKDLQPGRAYYYQVGVRSNATDHVQGVASTTGRTLRFQVPDDRWPLRIGLLGDPGQTFNTVSTLQNLQNMAPDVLLLLGDLSYADEYAPNGTLAAKAGTYQPRWDSWGRLFEPLLSRVPFLHTNGNHEIEDVKLKGKSRFGSYNHRFPTPAQGSNEGAFNFSGVGAAEAHQGRPNNLYYSTDLPHVKVISLTSYIPGDDFSPATAQYKWLQAELEKVDREATPWLIVMWHAPWYTSYAAHFKEAECFRQGFEALLVAHNVDLVVNGHVHSYERSKPVFDWKLNDCGPVHLVVGNGGNLEGMYADFIDQPANPVPYCTDPNKRVFPTYQPQRCFSWQDGEYCWKKQPQWSAYREASFGSGMLRVANATHAFFSWSRNQDEAFKHVDKVWIQRNPRCPKA